MIPPCVSLAIKKPTKTNIYTWYFQVPATPVFSGTNKPQTVLDIQSEPQQTTTTPEDEEAPLTLSASRQLTAGAATSPVSLILHLFGTEPSPPSAGSVSSVPGSDPIKKDVIEARAVYRGRARR